MLNDTRNTTTNFNQQQPPKPKKSGADELVDLVAAALPPDAKLAVFDAVTSNTALLLPLERLIALCRAKVCVFVVCVRDVDAAAAVAAFENTNTHTHTQIKTHK